MRLFSLRVSDGHAIGEKREKGVEMASSFRSSGAEINTTFVFFILLNINTMDVFASGGKMNPRSKGGRKVSVVRWFLKHRSKHTCMVAKVGENNFILPTQNSLSIYKNNRTYFRRTTVFKRGTTTDEVNPK